MLFRKRTKDAATPVGNPFWLKWLVAAFIAYAAYLHFTGKGPENRLERRMQAAGTEESSPIGQQAAGPNEIVDTRIRVGGDIAGTGDAASCGQTATVHTEASLPDGSPLPGEDANASRTLTVGLPDEHAPVWVSGVAGMKKGGVREIIVPAASLFDADARKAKGISETADIRYKIWLDELSPALPKDSIGLRLSNTGSSHGQTVQCGDHVRIHLTLWGADGKRLYTSYGEDKRKPLEVQVGTSDVFYGLDRGMLGMREEGSRSLTVPPAYMTAPQENPILSALPKNQVISADVDVIAVVHKP